MNKVLDYILFLKTRILIGLKLDFEDIFHFFEAHELAGSHIRPGISFHEGLSHSLFVEEAFLLSLRLKGIA